MSLRGRKEHAIGSKNPCIEKVSQKTIQGKNLPILFGSLIIGLNPFYKI